MIWAAIWGQNHSNVYFLDRDFESKKHGYSAQSYIKVLEDNLRNIWESGLEFMQDNAPIHSAQKVQDWLKNHEIPVMTWPPYSPDLNPIENAWNKLKNTIYTIDPELKNMKGKSEEVKQRFIIAIMNAWEALGDDYFEGLVRSMDTRVNAVLEAKGWYTRY
jgi:transposase